jgi:excisionase family DNA binding protein
MADDELLTPEEAAELLKLSVYHLARLRREGGGPAYSKVGHRTVRYSRVDIDAWLAAGRAAVPGRSVS